MTTRFRLSSDVQVSGNYIQGKFSKPTEVSGEWVCRSPADLSDEIGTLQYSYSSVEQAVQASRNAFLPWRRLTLADRTTYIKKYQTALIKRQDLLIEVISRE